MSWNDFYLNQNAGASDLNAGSTCSDVGGGSDAAIYTSVGGNFDGTSVFTPTDGSTPASFITANVSYVSLYNTGDTTGRCVALATAVGAGVNGTVTISTTIKYGTVPTSNSGSRALKCGGAWTSLAIGTSPGFLQVSATTPQSTRINIKAATYANTTTNRAVSLSASATALVQLRGYKATPGDQDANNVAVAGTDIPLITWTSAQLSLAATSAIYQNLAISGTSAAPISVGNNNPTFIRCQFSNTSASATKALFSTAQTVTCIGCSFAVTSTTTTAAVTLSGNYSTLLGCNFTGGSTALAFTSGVGNDVEWCVFDSIAGDCITSTTGYASIKNCSFYNPTGNGLNVTGTPTNRLIVANCYFENVNQASKAAINNTSGTNTNMIFCVANGYYNCTANLSGITESFALFDNGTLGSAGFVAPASQNFAVNPVAWNIGYPGKFEGTSTYQGYLAVGAVQPAPGGCVGYPLIVRGHRIVVG